MIKKFRLQRLLDIKRHKEEMLKNELLKLNNKYKEEENLLYLYYQKLNSIGEELTKQQQGEILLNTLKLLHNYFLYQENKVTSQKSKLSDLEKEIEITLNNLIGASQEKQLFNRLKEKYLRLLMLDMLNREQEVLNEVGLTMWRRKKC